LTVIVAFKWLTEMKLFSKYEKQSTGFCARMKDGPKVMLKCRPNGGRFWRPLKGLLN